MSIAKIVLGLALIGTVMIVGIWAGIMMLCGIGTAPNPRCIRKARLFLEMLILSMFNTIAGALAYAAYLSFSEKAFEFDHIFFGFLAFVLFTSTASPIIARMLTKNALHRIEVEAERVGGAVNEKV